MISWSWSWSKFFNFNFALGALFLLDSVRPKGLYRFMIEINILRMIVINQRYMNIGEERRRFGIVENLSRQWLVWPNWCRRLWSLDKDHDNYTSRTIINSCGQREEGDPGLLSLRFAPKRAAREPLVCN